MLLPHCVGSAISSPRRDTKHASKTLYQAFYVEHVLKLAALYLNSRSKLLTLSIAISQAFSIALAVEAMWKMGNAKRRRDFSASRVFKPTLYDDFHLFYDEYTTTIKIEMLLLLLYDDGTAC